MKWNALVLVLFMALVVPVFALQASDAENLVAQGPYLISGERAAVFHALPQSSGAVSYWLVSVYQGDSLETMLPFADADSSMVKAGVLRTNLISAQLLVQRITALKASTPWLISLSTANKLGELATAVDNEQFDVDIVVQAVSNASVKSDVAALKGKLSTLSAALRMISDQVKALNTDEIAFLNVSIDTTRVNSVAADYTTIYGGLVDALDQANAYDASVAQVKSRIAALSGVDSTTKSQWISLLTPLGTNLSMTGAVSPYSDLGVDNQQRLAVEVASLPTKVAALESEADARVARANAYSVLYGEDASLKKSTGFSSLQEGVASILSEANRPLWSDSVSVGKLETAWTNAEKAFNHAQYASAIDLANTAKGLVKKIKDAGAAASTDSTQSLSTNIVSGLVLVLAGAAVILVGKTVWKYVKPSPRADDEE